MLRRVATSAAAVVVLMATWSPAAHAETQPKPAWLTPNTHFQKLDIAVTDIPIGATLPKPCVPFINGCSYDHELTGDSGYKQISSCEYITTNFQDYYNIEANFYFFFTTIDLELTGYSQGMNLGDEPCVTAVRNMLDDDFNFHGIALSVGAGNGGGDVGASGTNKDGDYKAPSFNSSYAFDSYQTSAHGTDMYEYEHTTTWTTSLDGISTANTEAYASAWL